MNPLAEIAIIWRLVGIFKQIRPHVAHLFTIKPVLYGSIAAKLSGVPIVLNAITGLGHVFIDEKPITKIIRTIVKTLYRFSLKGTIIIFQNQDDRGLFIKLGILAALKQNTVWDYFGMGIAILGVSVPVIVLGPIFVWVFGVALKWFPPTGWGAKPPYLLGFLPSDLGWDFFKFAIMPSVALGLGSSGVLARLTRATLLQTVREDYIRTARAKGLQERVIIMRHALKNSLIPVVTILGPLFAALVTGTFVTELMFGIPGMGKYFVTSITNRDYPVIMGTILLYAVFLVVANLLVDITYAFLDPRIRYD